MGDRYTIERRGGLAGLTATGIVDGDALDPDDRQRLEQLLDDEGAVDTDPGADRYRYLVSRANVAGTTTREIPESLLPSSVARLVETDI